MEKRSVLKKRKLAKEILKSARPLSAWEFARDVGNKINPGINYVRCGKKDVIQTVLGETYRKLDHDAEGKMFELIEKAIVDKEERQKLREDEKRITDKVKEERRKARNFLLKVCEENSIQDSGRGDVVGVGRGNGIVLHFLSEKKVKFVAAVTSEQVGLLLNILGIKDKQRK